MADKNTIDENLLEKWNEFKRIVEANEIDIIKNAQGNASAGIRARHGLRLLKGRVADLVKISMGKPTSSESSDE